MRPHYIVETGIRPWEESESLSSSLATISIIVASLEDLLPIINALLSISEERFAHWYRWYTLGQAFEGNEILKRKLADKLSLDAGGFKDPVVRMGDRIISSVSSVTLPFTAFELETISDYRRELIIGAADSEATSENLSSLMAAHSGGLYKKALAGVLASTPNLIFGRCFHDEDTHAVFQWFGHQADLRLLDHALARLDVESLKSRMEVIRILG